tara:strand:+ start:250 stop:891 length:642 start_codon:yes stop_codon:yes gene_type:complete
MGQAQLREEFLATREEFIAHWGGTDESTGRDAFHESSGSGAEMMFLDAGVAIWLPVGDRDGDEYLLRSLARVELHYPIRHDDVLDVLDSMQGMFDAHCSLFSMNPEDVHELTQVATGLRDAGEDEGDSDSDRLTVSLEKLESRVTCAGCGRPAPVIYQETVLKDVWRLDVDEFLRDEPKGAAAPERGEQVALTAHCPSCDNEWPVRVDMGELL